MIYKSTNLKLVKDAVVLIQAAKLRAKVLMDGEGLDGFRLHVQIPHFHWQIVPENIRQWLRILDDKSSFYLDIM